MFTGQEGLKPHFGISESFKINRFKFQAEIAIPQQQRRRLVDPTDESGEVNNKSGRNALKKKIATAENTKEQKPCSMAERVDINTEKPERENEAGEIIRPAAWKI